MTAPRAPHPSAATSWPLRELTREELKDPTVLLLPIAEQLLRVIGSTDSETAEERAMEASRNIVCGLVDGECADVFGHVRGVITSPLRMHPMVADSRRKTIALVATDITLLYLDRVATVPSELHRFTLAVAVGVPITLLRHAWGRRES